MSDESIQSIRKPTANERRLIAALAARAGDLKLPVDWLETLHVLSLADGGMGSLRLIFPDPSATTRAFHKQAAELVFNDADGVQVTAALNIDSAGLPMELDVWKTDFSALIRIPDDL